MVPVQGVFGQMLHAMASGLFGLMSVILPVFLALVAFSLMRKRKSGNVRMVAGWSMILWSVCSYSMRRSPSDPKVSTWRCCRMREVCFGFARLSVGMGLSKAFAIVIFVVVILFSLLLITNTGVTRYRTRRRLWRPSFG